MAVHGEETPPTVTQEELSAFRREAAATAAQQARAMSAIMAKMDKMDKGTDPGTTPVKRKRDLNAHVNSTAFTISLHEDAHETEEFTANLALLMRADKFAGPIRMRIATGPSRQGIRPSGLSHSTE